MNRSDTRADNLARLRDETLFDLIVIGGGATGCGIALDAATRGLKVALVEKNDFAEGTSSRSTKLVHGGVRYLEMAVKRLDPEQYQLVKEGLHERDLLLKNACHLANRLALVTPVYKWFKVPYIYTGLKFYDLLAGWRNIGHSRLLGRREALRRFPALKAQGLKGGVLYYDGQFHDARMALTLALTAADNGAVISNHVGVTALIKEKDRLVGVELCDSLNGDSWQLRARGIINATGPFVDNIRRMDDPDVENIIAPSSGIHIVLDKRFAPPDTGLMIPATEDGRVLFVLPWEGHALVGTTDEAAQVSEHPCPRTSEIDYLLRHVGRYFNLQVERADIKAVWSGLRPLVSDPAASDTAKLVRHHVIVDSQSGLLTIAGGKWTSYRRMAQDSVDHAIRQFKLQPLRPSCQTQHLALLGSANYVEQDNLELCKQHGLADDIAAYLNRTYGDQAAGIIALAGAGHGERLVDCHPEIEAEIIYAARHELAQRVMDVLARRTPLALLDTSAALQAAPRVLDIMAQELGWDETRCHQEMQLVEKRLTQGL